MQVAFRKMADAVTFLQEDWCGPHWSITIIDLAQRLVDVAFHVEFPATNTLSAGNIFE